jgi:hypothetical protein
MGGLQRYDKEEHARIAGLCLKKNGQCYVTPAILKRTMKTRKST